MENDVQKLKEWIEKELMISGGREELSYALNSVKEHAKRYIKLSREEGSVTLLLQARKLQKCWQIYLYLVGKAYGYIAELFKDYSVTNKELEERLKLPSGTIKSCLKDLREKDWIISPRRGVHKINHSRIKEVFNALRQEVVESE